MKTLIIECLQFFTSILIGIFILYSGAKWFITEASFIGFFGIMIGIGWIISLFNSIKIENKDKIS